VSISQIYLPVDAEAARNSAMAEFARNCGSLANRDLQEWPALQGWALAEPRRFWRAFVDWSQLEVSGDLEPVLSSDDCEFAKFFPNARFNYARNLLRARDPSWDSRVAITETDESGGQRGITRGELREYVERIANGLRELGVVPGDRVVGIARNSIDAYAAALASSAVGAMWSSVAPDLGDVAILDRFGQLSPRVLFAHTSARLHGVTRSLVERLAGLSGKLDSLEAVITFEEQSVAGLREGVRQLGVGQLAASGAWPMAQWPAHPFNQPLFVLFSSGTTGVPKCLMHGAGGTLLEHYKELHLHSGFGPDDKLYFHTSAGWMMWNWTLSALACGTELLVFDGSPTFPTPDALLKLLDREQVTVFGTSATYLHALAQLAIVPKDLGSFARLRAIQSTGSILYEAQYDWIRDNFKHVAIHSISGGTDMIGCFVLGNPLLPVYRGDSQCVSLGLDVKIMTDDGVKATGEGELICVRPFPSRPVGVYGDADGTRFHNAYFSQNAGVWTHGDLVRLFDNGAARILGRSDGTLKVRGVRIGPAEIYNVVLRIPDVAQALAVEQSAPRDPGGSRLLLLVVLQPGKALDRPLTLRIKKDLNQQASQNHVPAVIAQVSGLPTTHSGKLSERAVRDLVNGKAVVNRNAMRNPEVLDEIRQHADLQPQNSPEN
jgi:acetoacetyl-CoA synthetase